MKPLSKTKDLKSGFYVQKYDPFSDDVVYIDTYGKVYLYVPKYDALEPSRQKLDTFIKDWRAHQFALYPIKEEKFLGELRETTKGIDRPGYNRLGFRVIKNPGKKHTRRKTNKKRAKKI